MAKEIHVGLLRQTMTGIVYKFIEIHCNATERINIPHSSMNIGTAPKAATESTTKYVPYL